MASNTYMDIIPDVVFLWYVGLGVDGMKYIMLAEALVNIEKAIQLRRILWNNKTGCDVSGLYPGLGLHKIEYNAFI